MVYSRPGSSLIRPSQSEYNVLTTEAVVEVGTNNKDLLSVQTAHEVSVISNIENLVYIKLLERNDSFNQFGLYQTFRT